MRLQWMQWMIIAGLSWAVTSCGLFADDPPPVAPDCSITGTCTNSSSGVVLSSASTGPVYYGVLPTPTNPAKVSTMYQVFKELYISTPEQDAQTYAGREYAQNPQWWMVKPGSGAMRVKWDKDTATVSEGVAYGMLIALFAGDWETFNGLWVYNSIMRQEGAHKLMPWLLVGFYNPDKATSATDADLDIATALILAYQKTGFKPYLDSALVIGNLIWTHEIDPTTLLVWPANDRIFWDPSNSAWNPSYISPVAFRLLAQYDPYHPWLDALDANYNWLQAVQNDNTGLFCDWAYPNGTCGRPANQSATSTSWQYHGLEALRISWRLTWDYHWYGDPRAKAMMSLLAKWLIMKTEGDPNRLGGGSINPVTGEWSNADGSRLHYVGNFCIPGMVDPALNTWASTCHDYLLNSKLYPPGKDPGYPSSVKTRGYFSDILVMMFMQMLNGFYLK